MLWDFYKPYDSYAFTGIPPVRYAVRNTPRGANLYPAAGAVGRGAPGGTAEMVTLLWKSGEGAGEYLCVAHKN